MRTGIIQTIRRYAPCLMLLLILSCDSFKEDFIEPGNQVIFSQTEYYILPGSSVIIDLKSIIKQSFTNVTVSISQKPLRGVISDLDTLLLKYKAGAEFTAGKDQFVFSVLSDGKILKSETMTIFMKQRKDEFPCALYTVEDRARVKSGLPVSIRYLKNDRLCGINNATLRGSIHSNPRFGNATLAGDSIVYTPGSAFSGHDELVYKVTASSGESISYGLITVTDSKIEFLNVPNGLTNIFFVDDTIGFLGGDDAIFKTTDGGVHWDLASFPTGVNQNQLYFNDIFFLNATIGFTAFDRIFPIDYNEGGWMMTTDGGRSWKVNYVRYPVNSIFFISPKIGFISIAIYALDLSLKHAILKTKDGGITWEEVFTHSAPYGELRIRFTDSTTGYAYQAPNNIFVTTDAGESWKLSTTNKYILSLAVGPDNVSCATFSEGESATTPSSIVRTTDGINWKPVANFPFNNWRLGFSPVGMLGVAVGINGPNPQVDDPLSQTLSISNSTDRGETWSEDEITEPLYGFPWAIAVPSDDVAYILCSDKLIKYTP